MLLTADLVGELKNDEEDKTLGGPVAEDGRPTPLPQGVEGEGPAAADDDDDDGRGAGS